MQNLPEQTKQNPLAGFMRQPKIYVKLPSNGRYWAQDSLTISANGEYPVYSMTAKDELMLKTPDALLNGQAVVSVLQSCIPNIVDAWAAPTLDLDAMLIAIRMATYGDSMETNVTVAGVDATYTVDLRSLLDDLYATITWEETIDIGNNVVIYVRPLTYKELSKASVETFETQRIMNIVNDETIAEDRKLELFKESFSKLTQVTLGLVSESVFRIDTESGQVTDPSFIKEFFDQCDRDVFNKVKDKLDELKDKNSVKPMKVRATDDMIAAGSEEQIEVPILFDPANFFA
jgi:hypothetical protein